VGQGDSSTRAQSPALRKKQSSHLTSIRLPNVLPCLPDASMNRERS
jgi:hypothetical protein